MFEHLRHQYIYVAHPDYLEALQQELGEPTTIIGNLVFSPVKNEHALFAQDMWLTPRMVKITSINDAIRILKAENVTWHPHVIASARRTALIAAKLPTYHDVLLSLDKPPKNRSIGCFSLLDAHTLLYSAARSSLIPDGVYVFDEDKKGPPNRAYLKLWEALYRLGRYPQKGDVALDLGASPGGWTYVLQSFGAQVTAIDKAPLDPAIATLPGVTTYQQSAFALNPHDFKQIDWLVCDVACYPDKLFSAMEKWLAAGNVKQFICTIKLQGEPDAASIHRFLAIEGSTVMHLFNNKHELTWLYPGIPTHDLTMLL